MYLPQSVLIQEIENNLNGSVRRQRLSQFLQQEVSLTVRDTLLGIYFILRSGTITESFHHRDMPAISKWLIDGRRIIPTHFSVLQASLED